MADTNDKSPKASSATTKDAGQKDLQQQFDKETAQGFVGVEVDPTPNEAYTLQGVTKGMSTPENDLEYGKKIQQQVAVDRKR